ncbi:hypothetical protein EC988_009752, partial [Linderina pennispora]
GIQYVEDTMICKANKPIYFFAVAVLISLLVVCAVFTYMARDIQSSFNEFRELLATFFVTIIAILVQVILRWVPNISGNEFAYNTLVTLTDFIVCQVNFYFLVSKPTFHCLVNREAYLRFFLKKLRRENNESVYEIANGAQMQRWSTNLDRTGSEAEMYDEYYYYENSPDLIVGDSVLKIQHPPRALV